MTLSVLCLFLPLSAGCPTVGCDLTPCVILRCPDGSTISMDIPETAPFHGFYLKQRWYRIQDDYGPKVCCVHPSEPATLYCEHCKRAKAFKRSYYCATKCSEDSFVQHKMFHARMDGVEPEEILRSLDDNYVGSIDGTLMPLSNVLDPVHVVERSKPNETWYEVGCKRAFIPSTDDVGYRLKFECTLVDSSTGCSFPSSNLWTERVIAAPSPVPRCMIPLHFVDESSHFCLDSHITPAGNFTILSYNVLADIYAGSDRFGYCPSWARSWAYRCQNLLREIIRYRADILCLQEVQSNHFLEFFAPELEKYGYIGVYTKKEGKVHVGKACASEGCATFFRQKGFSLVKKYEIDFRRAGKAFAENPKFTAQGNKNWQRFLRGNVALIVVLEVHDSVHEADGSVVLKLHDSVHDAGGSVPGNSHLLCVANTHVCASPKLKDVKLWQVQTLLRGIEKIVENINIPILVCGDFNSVPGSAPHVLLTSGKVEASHPDLAYDPLSIFQPASALRHKLLLVSAYSAFTRSVPQFAHMDAVTKEPLFTNYTPDFLGTLDYIFFSVDLIAVEALLELLDEKSVQALPSPMWSSDHIALAARFRLTARSLQKFLPRFWC